jgi:hypothetical protein
MPPLPVTVEGEPADELAWHCAWPHSHRVGEFFADFSQRGLQYFLPSAGAQLQ